MTFFKNKSFVVHIICALFVSVYSIKFYDGTKTESYDCSVKFEPKKEFTCVCLSGVWKFYKSECEEIRSAGGLDYCLELQDPIYRAERVLDSSDDISIRYPNGSILHVAVNNEVPVVDVTDLLTTGGNWTATSDLGVSVCISAVADNYCQFSLETQMTQVKFTRGCDATIPQIKGKNCEDLQSSAENICVSQNSSRRQTGRVFLMAPGMNKSVTIISDPKNMVQDDDEDFFDPLNVTESRDEISTEIWNFIDKKLDNILAITNATQNNNRYSVLPIFRILQLARDVMKKTCPDFYVNPQFFDMATYAFIEMQKKAFKQKDFPVEYSAYGRIANALKNCSNYSQPFPFVNNFTCNDDGLPQGVYYTVLNTTSEVNVHFKNLPVDREPIIETVWKIFSNAHATCYSYFDDSYNDHHRFTTWMTPLFQNDINDVWLINATSNATVFGNMFGNMNDIQTRISFCSGYSRLDSEYPWDLPIPSKANFTAGRRKRATDVAAINGECIAPTQFPKC